MSPEDIVEQFPLWNFFVANEIAMNLTTWVALLRQKSGPRATAMQGETHSNELLAAIVKCEENAGRTMENYVESLRHAFGVRYEDIELRDASRPLNATDMFAMLQWAESIRDAYAVLECWLKDSDHKDHLVWKEST